MSSTGGMGRAAMFYKRLASMISDRRVCRIEKKGTGFAVAWALLF